MEMEHTRSCPALNPASDDSCTCGLEQRKQVYDFIFALSEYAPDIAYADSPRQFVDAVMANCGGSKPAPKPTVPAPEAIIEGDCPRRGSPRNPEIFTYDAHPDYWRTDKTCSYCGSLHPEYVLERIRKGDVTITPTDKSYKVYLKNSSGEALPSTSGKFYFQHFSREQAIEFTDLHNAKKLTLNYPGHFYVRPYFWQVA